MRAKKWFDLFMGIWLGLMILVLAAFIAANIPLSQIPGIMFLALALSGGVLWVSCIFQERAEKPKRKRVSRDILNRLSETTGACAEQSADEPETKAQRK